MLRCAPAAGRRLENGDNTSARCISDLSFPWAKLEGALSIYRLWRSDGLEPFTETDARDCKHAVALFASQLGEPLTLEEQPALAPYMLDVIEPNLVKFREPPSIPVWRRSKD